MNSRRSACVSYVWPRVAQSARRLKNLEPLNIAPSPDRTSQGQGTELPALVLTYTQTEVACELGTRGHVQCLAKLEIFALSNEMLH